MGGPSFARALFARGGRLELRKTLNWRHLRLFLSGSAIQFMKKLYTMVLISLLTTSSLAGDLAGSFKEAVALAKTEDTDRATRIYSDIDLKDYYQQKYFPVFQSCLKSIEHPDPSTFEFVVAIGKDGRVLRLYTDHETNVLACVRPTLLKDEFPHPPVAPYYQHFTMSFSK
ncbi:MAG TPA: hypothetical protein VK812_12085 [Candidatus Binatus sp.]|nr:hypothetical protein [Candidatus Binatus sp.]